MKIKTFIFTGWQNPVLYFQYFTVSVIEWFNRAPSLVALVSSGNLWKLTSTSVLCTTRN